MPQITRFYGVNTGDAATEIADQEATICQNLFLSGRSLTLRNGFTSSFVDTATSSAAVSRVHRAYISSGFWMWECFNAILSDQPGSQTIIAPGSACDDFIDANNYVYILRGSQGSGVLRSDGTAIGTIAHPDAQCPTARVGAWHRGRLFLDDNANRSKLWFSSTNDPDTFIDQSSSTVATEGGWILVSPGDGDRITGLCPLGSALFIFKGRSIHLLLGSSFAGSEEFRLIELYRGTGALLTNTRAIVQVQNGIIFPDQEGKFQYFHGPTRRLYSGIGRPIENLSSAAGTVISRASAFYFDQKYFVSFSTDGGSTYKAYCLDMRLIAPYLTNENEGSIPSGWTELTNLTWGDATIRSGEFGDATFPYVAGTALNGTVYEYLSGTTDNGAVIPFAWKSKAYGADAPAVVKSVSEFTVAQDATVATVGLDMNFFADMDPTVSEQSNLASADTKPFALITWKPPATAKGKTVQVGFSSSSGTGFEALSVDWEWHPQRKSPVTG